MMISNLPSVTEGRALSVSDNEYWSPANQANELQLMEEKLSPRGKGLAIVESIKQGAGSDWSELASSFDALPDTCIEAVEAELGAGPVLMLTPANWDDMQRYRSVDYGAELIREWGHDAPARVAQVEARMQRLADSLSEPDFKSLLHWFNAASPEEQKAIERALAR